MKKDTDISPWWVNAPSYLQKGIVGVPSFIAIVVVLWMMHTYDKSSSRQLDLLNKHMEQMEVLTGYVHDDIRVHDTDDAQAEKDRATTNRILEAQLAMTQQTCINAAKSGYQVGKCTEARNKAEQSRDFSLLPRDFSFPIKVDP